MKYRLLICALTGLGLTGCVTYTSEYANDGYYSSPRDSYYEEYGDNDDYYGDPGNYGQYNYANSVFSHISISFNFGNSYPNYGYYPSYYGYSRCSYWSPYCYVSHHPGYGWGYSPYYSYYLYQPHHHHHQPKPKPPKHKPDNPKHNVGQPGLHPRYPIVDREDGPRPRQPQYRPIQSVPQQQGQTQPIANGGTPNTPQYPRQQPRVRPSLPLTEGNNAAERERYTARERFVERAAMPRQQPRTQPEQSEDANNDYARFPQAPRNAPVQQGQAPLNRPLNNQQHINAAGVIAQQRPQLRSQTQPKPERRERSESKQPSQKVERDATGDKP